MNNKTYFLLNQICKFGGLPVNQLSGVCGDIYKTSSLYGDLKKLFKLEYISSLRRPGGHESIIFPTNKTLQLFFGFNCDRRKHLSVLKIDHAVQVAQTLVELSYYTNVSGLITEHELSDVNKKKYAYSKVPDGIIQVSSEADCFNLAIEVECSLKKHSRIDGLFNSYKITFEKNLKCVGVIIVCSTEKVFNAYTKHYDFLPELLKDRFLIIRKSGLDKLNTRVYGERINDSESRAEKLRAVSMGKMEIPYKIQEASANKWDIDRHLVTHNQ